MPTSKTTYVAYPKDSIHARATARRLSASLAKSGETADYLIFQQDEDEGRLDFWSLEYFRTRAIKRGRQVVFLPSYRSICDGCLASSNSLPDWISIIDPADQISCITKLAILKGPRAYATAPWAEVEHDLSQIRQLFLAAVGADSEIELEIAFGTSGIADHFQGFVAGKFHRLLASPECDDFFYLLALLTQSYAEQSHDLNKVDPNLVGSLAREIRHAGPTGILEAMGRRAMAKAVLIAAESLRETMKAPALRAADGAFKVLLIDDDAFAEGGQPSYGKSLCGIAHAFFPEKWEVFVWNPIRQNNDVFCRLCRYKSIDADPECRDLEISVQNIVSAGTACSIKNLSLIDLAKDFDFILIDQLYRSPADVGVDFASSTGGRKDFGQILGPKLIRGLKRTLHDFQFSVLGPPRLPQIIALSHDSDPARIQDAIRSGARDYVLKSQLLRLPAVMSKVQHSIGEGSDFYHKNFPELYRLPSETQGLLRTLRIPGLRSLHRISSDSQKAQATSVTDGEVSRLLRRIPKSDLHVHVGSCMSPEYLVVASVIGLARGLARELEDIAKTDKDRIVSNFVADVGRVASAFRALTGFRRLKANWLWSASDLLPGQGAAHSVPPGEKWLSTLGQVVRGDLTKRLLQAGKELSDPEGWMRYQKLRAFLHAEMAIRDRLSLEDARKQIAGLTDLDAAFFGIRFAADLLREEKNGFATLWCKDDLIRIYLLTLSVSQPYKTRLKTDKGNDVLAVFRSSGKLISKKKVDDWYWLQNFFFPSKGEESLHSLQSYRRAGWRLPSEVLPFQLTMSRPFTGEDFAEPAFYFYSAPIEYSLSTGLRSTNLVQYLEGCEFSGAEHLRHPFLIHLYAQQVVVDLVLKGVFYAELRAAPDGYVDPALGFEFPYVCRCIEEAFSQAQQELLSAYRWTGPIPEKNNSWIAGVLGERYCYRQVSMYLDRSAPIRCIPCKVSLIYVGKRHKPTREMILEAAAAAVMRPSGEYPIRTSSEFIEREFSRCRVVGFDLAGKEVGNPPERFVEEFGRLSRLHIPLTVHAGENESAQFVEDSILRLRARRIGHGLSLVEDRGLMARVREDRIGIELCPMSNFQTSHFGGPESSRPYPLRKLLAAGILVSINTDNPIISHTNIVREFFQASYAWGDTGMPLWEALRLVRMGFVMSFLNLQERRAILEIVGQFLFDLFCEESTVEALRDLSFASEVEQGLTVVSMSSQGRSSP